MRLKLVSLLFLGVLLFSAVGWLAPVPAIAAPEPEPVPRRWELTIVPGDLRLTTVNVPGEGHRAYFYFTYSVINNTGDDRNLAPSFELATDEGKLSRSGRGVPRYATEAIRSLLGSEFMQDEISIQGLLLQGEENAKEGFVVWPAENLKADEYTIYAAGFSGETKAVARPDNGETVVLRKTLMLRHDAPGELDPTSGRALVRTVTRWILR